MRRDPVAPGDSRADTRARVSRASVYIQDIHAGRAVIDSLVRERLFARERATVFEQILHASDMDFWLAHREERSSRSILDPRIVERVRELLARANGEILVVNRGYACRLRRLGGSSEGTSTEPTRG